MTVRGLLITAWIITSLIGLGGVSRIVRHTRSLWTRIIGVGVGLCLLGTLAMAILSATTPETPLRSSALALADCPASPNCVSSQAANEDALHHIDAIPFEGPPEAAMARLRAAILTLPRTDIHEETGRSIHATSSSLLFRFIDDLDCLVIASDKKIHCRSSSRVGHGDMGVNRARVEHVRGAFEERLAR